MSTEPDDTMLAIDRAFDDGREQMAYEVQEFLSNYGDDGVPVEDLEEFLALQLGYEPNESDVDLSEWVVEMDAAHLEAIMLEGESKEGL